MTREKWNHYVLADDGPSWSRLLIRQAEKNDCEQTYKTLKTYERKMATPIDRMVVGHTIQHSGHIGR